ncbi:MAG: hypothetical protein ACOCPQ_00575 [Desulfosudaceae bacterium]
MINKVYKIMINHSTGQGKKQPAVLRGGCARPVAVALPGMLLYCSKFKDSWPHRKFKLGRQSKKFKIKAQRILRKAAYLAVREIPRNAVQRSRLPCGNGTFYEAVKNLK